MIYTMAKVGSEDGRRMVIFYVSDCDPAGWQMAVSVARKLQAFKVMHFPELDFEMRPIALTPEQVRTHGLPSTPLKDTEKRKDRWKERMGVEQTEIDTLVAPFTSRPGLLRQMVTEAMGPFYDHTLARRVQEARLAWWREAHAALDEQIDRDELDEAMDMLGELRREFATNEALHIGVDDLHLPTQKCPRPN
jgi:hypothetical protein